MPNKFRWKEKATREAVLFYVAVVLLAYWGVRENFDVNELYLGAVVYILTGLSIFTSSFKPKDPTPKDEDVVLESKQDAKRSSDDSNHSSRSRILWSSLWPKRLGAKNLFRELRH